MKKNPDFINTTINSLSLILLVIILVLVVSINKFPVVDVSKLPPKKVKIFGPIPEKEAADMVDTYRNSITLYKKTKSFWHKPGEVSAYINSIMTTYAPTVPPPANYEWQLGFSPMFYNENGKARLTTCFVPILVRKDNPKDVLDFFEERDKNSNYYKDYFKVLNDKVITATGNTFIFDEGHLWP